MLRISFVATFDVTAAAFMLAEQQHNGWDLALWFSGFKEEILCQNCGQL